MSDVLDLMAKCRQVCYLGHRLRHEQNIPTRAPLKELQYEGVYLPQEYRDLIRDDVNVESVNPFFCKGEFEQLFLNRLKWYQKLLMRMKWYEKRLRKKYEILLGEKWVETKDKEMTISLNIFLDDYQIKKGQDGKERREKIMKKKLCTQ
jgi:hypothetical protein